MKNKLYHHQILNKIASYVYKVTGTLEIESSLTGEPVSWEEHKSLSYSPIKKGMKWGRKKYDCAWMIVKGHHTGLKDEFAILDIGGEALVYTEEGKIITSITTTSNRIDHFQVLRGKILIPLKDLNHHFELHIDASYNGTWQGGSYSPKIRRADIAVRNPLMFQLYYIYQTIYRAMTVVKNQAIHSEYNDILIEASHYILNPEKAIKTLNQALEMHSEEELKLYAIGHGHLDLAWLWPLRETHRKAARTLIAQLNNIYEYPGYIYGVSQPQMLLWVKKEHPDLYEEVKKALISGSLEAQGGMWTECDCNLTGGESFIRQFHYGTKFWKEEFGLDVKTCWLPDVFGFSGSLPQIIKGCGMDSFMTIKLSWNRTNKFPYHSFKWQGIDGTEVLTHMDPEGDYTSAASPKSLQKISSTYHEKKEAPEALLIYGVGDGGCGPSIGHLEMVYYERDLAGLPKTEMSSAEKFFEVLKKDEENLPTYPGELYLEKHQGTFTTQGKNKKYNRKMEIKLHTVEYLLSVMILKEKSIEKYNLDDIWQEVLLYQFHDILPGSSITRVYKETTERYQIIEETLDQMIQEISALVSVKEGFFNPSPVDISTVVEWNHKGYLLEAKAYENASLKELSKPVISFEKNVIENSKLRVVFNPSGEIISCFDKINNVESVKKPWNQLVVYSDPRIIFNAWDIYPGYEKLPKSKFKLISSTTRLRDDAVIMSHHYKYHKSELKQDVILRVDSPYIEFNTEVDWHERHKLLRADFYPEFFGDKVICDSQFGYKEYRTLEDNPLDKAKYEIHAHKFVDTSLNGYGVALLNDCKYGHRVKNGKISLALLRSPIEPDPLADRGHHQFKYAIYPHKGEFIEAKTQELGYAFNYELLHFNIEDSFIIKSSNPQVLIETVKPSNDGQGIVVRLYDKSGTNQSTTLSYNDAFDLYLAQMLETNETSTKDVQTFHPFEIKTLILRKKK